MPIVMQHTIFLLDAPLWSYCRFWERECSGRGGCISRMMNYGEPKEAVSGGVVEGGLGPIGCPDCDAINHLQIGCFLGKVLVILGEGMPGWRRSDFSRDEPWGTPKL